MFKDFGKAVRAARLQKGINIADFAKKIGVSTGYLSNLETCKTETINFEVLEKINKELNLFPPLPNENTDNEFEMRLYRLTNLLSELQATTPKQADYFMSLVEQGADLLSREETSASLSTS